MITEWIDVNVQHHSKFDGYTSIGRCKLILKAILNDDALVRFDGPITRSNVETGKIKGVATFKFLPIFAQMVGGLHTELGSVNVDLLQFDAFLTHFTQCLWW